MPAELIPPLALIIVMDANKFYKSKKWLDKREHILKRDGYQDQLEKRAGKTIPAEVVHHIFPREQYPEYQWEDWNLISISDKTHKTLHTVYGNLSYEGEQLKKEVARERNIPFCKKTLVVGLPGSGKTTYVKQHLDSGLCYDLDYIAAAFRLRKPDEEKHTGSRKMANAMAKAFAVNVERFASKAFIIRTAPYEDEIEAIDPDTIVVMARVFDPRKVEASEMAKLKIRLQNSLQWAKANGFEIVYLNDDKGEQGQSQGE